MSSRFKHLAKGRRSKRGERNRTETEFELLLEDREDVEQIWFEAITFRLSHPPKGQPATYTPDFMCTMSDETITVFEVKGAGLDDNASLVRLRAAADLFPLFRFVLAKKRAKKHGGGFELKEV